MSLPPFAVTWDYRCPFARNAHEHIVAGLRAGAPWDVTFSPFSLNQVHVEEGGLDVWDDPAAAPALLSMAAALAVRDEQPAAFLDVHEALFRARHDEGVDLRIPEVVAGVIDAAGGDGGAALSSVAAGGPLDVFRKEHEASVANYKVFGVPTFVVGEAAVFIRFMNRPKGDSDLAVSTVERSVALIVDFPELNEFKYSSLKR